MKAILNWRYWALALLFAGVIFGLCASPIDESRWIEAFLAGKVLAAVCLIALRLCVRRWDANGETPEFTNLK